MPLIKGLPLLLAESLTSDGFMSCGLKGLAGKSGVVLPIRRCPDTKMGLQILLNKRSTLVRQAGDLCCPGGSVHPHLDLFLGAMMLIPGLPFGKGPGWRLLRPNCLSHKMKVAVLWACSLREAWEEVRLPPWRISFLGILSPYRLHMFKKEIVPFVGFLEGRQRFRVNWEVDEIVPVSVESLLDPSQYGIYEISDYPSLEGGAQRVPCFLCPTEYGTEVLWGATYHIVMEFLRKAYGFEEPPFSTRRTFHGRLPGNYFGVPAREESTKGHERGH